MQRNSLIAMTVGTLGVVVAGTVAGLAVYKVASNSSEDPGASTLVAALPSTPAPVAPTLEPLQPTDLPALPVIETAAVTADQATQAVLDQAPGTTIKVRARSHQGSQSWAVQVQQSDGSIITGYVDQATGVVFDWTTDRTAPTSVDSGAAKDDGGAAKDDSARQPDDDQGSSGEHEGGEHEGGEHESNEDDD